MLVMYVIPIAILACTTIFAAVFALVKILAKRSGYTLATFTPRERVPVLNDKNELALDSSGRLDLRPTGQFVSFEPMFERYTKVAETLITLASASLLFVPSSRLNVYPQSCAFALVLLGSSVFYCVGFMVFLTYFYENFRYNQNSYTIKRSAMVHALGFSGLVCFALAYMLLAVRVAWAVIYTVNTPTKSII